MLTDSVFPTLQLTADNPETLGNRLTFLLTLILLLA